MVRLSSYVLSYNAFSNTTCDDQQTSLVNVGSGDEAHVREYDNLGRMTTRQINGVRTDYRYNGDGTLQAAILYQGEDASGNATDGFCTTYSDYSLGVARQIGHGAPAPGCAAPIYTVQRTVNPDGSLASITNGRGHTTGFDYDALGRLIEIRPPGENPITVTYDGGPFSFSTLRRVTQGAYWIESRFDGLAREIEKENAAGVLAHQTYDALGRVRFQSLPRYATDPSTGDTFDYDALGRLTSVTHADNSIISYSYGTDEHTVTVTDEENRQTILTRRAFGDPGDSRLVRVQLPGEPAPTQDTYTYLVGGHLTNVNYAGRQRIIGYNFAKRVVREYTPERGWVYWGYDAAGNLRCHDRSSFSVCNDTTWNNPAADIRYTVDGLGRVTQIAYESPAMTDVTFTYDHADNVSAMTDGVGTHTFDYTPTDRLAQQVSTISNVDYTTGYTYDSRGNRETITYPSGRVVTYGYDAGNRVTSVGGFVSSVAYHPNGLARRLTYANGVVTTLTLDPRQRPDTLNAPGVLNLDYDYDGVGNVTRLVDGINPTNTTSFDYDDLDRLTDAGGAWGSLAYSYNAAGDRTLEQLNGQGTTYTYDANGRLDQLSGRINLDFDFDTFGNVRQRGDFLYTYDLEDRMTQVADDQNNPLVGYGYNGQGQRVLVTRAGCPSTLVYHYDQQGNRIAESTGQGLILREYIVAAGRTIAQIDLAPLRISPGALDFGAVGKGAGLVQATRTISVTNRSSAVLSITSSPVSGQNFSADVNLPLQVPANTTVAVPVTLMADSLGEFTARLALCADNGMQLDVALKARVVRGPTAPNSHTAPASTSIAYVFGQPVDPASVTPRTFAVYAMFSGQILGTYNVNGGEIRLTPLQPLKPGERVYASLTTGVQFLGGNPLQPPLQGGERGQQAGSGPAAPLVWQFQVAPTSAGGGRFVDSGQALSETDAVSYRDSVALGDLDGDGDLDAFAGNGFANKVWRNDGNGRFSDSGQSLGTSGTPDIALGDLDGDGDLDAFAANGFAGNEVWLNNGDGTFGANPQQPDNAVSLSVALGDLDGDGDLDAFVGNGTGDQVWLNDGQGVFTDTGQLLGDAYTLDVALGDLDGDGDLDAYAATMRDDGFGYHDSVWINDGVANFSLGQTLNRGRINRKVAFGDLDGDGDLDAFVLDGPYRDVFFNNGTGRFGLGNAQYLLSPDGLSAKALSLGLGDLDGDGDLDALVGTGFGVELWLNDGTGSFSGETQTPSSAYGPDMALGDLDGDGDLDAFLVTYASQPNEMWWNTPACTLGTYDVVPDGRIDIRDIMWLASRWPATPVSEIMAAAGLWRQRCP